MKRPAILAAVLGALALEGLWALNSASAFPMARDPSSMPRPYLGQGYERAASLVNALIILNTQDLPSLDRAASAIRELGGYPLTLFPPDAIIGSLPMGVEATLLQHPSVQAVYRDLVDETLVQGLTPTAATAARIWNNLLAQAAQPAPPLPPPPDPPFPDALPPPDRQFAAEGLGPAPSSSQTSEFLYGSVWVDVFLVESTGGIDTNTENWSTSRAASVATEVTAGLTWWASTATQGGRPTANLSFATTFHTPFNDAATVATGYEPITRPAFPACSGEGLWIAQILSNAGYAATCANYRTVARSYAHDRRTANDRDWGFAIFVVDSNNDSDGLFADGFFAYAYLNGPFYVMTYDNNGWGIDRMEMVTAHEMGHTFGALDEYAVSGCTTSQTGGYLVVANTNCQNGGTDAPSIMNDGASQTVAYPANLASTEARGMVGWRDQDSDAWYDIIDTITNTLVPYSPDPTSNTSLTYNDPNQKAEDSPWRYQGQSSWCVTWLCYTPVSINNIANVQYQVDSGVSANTTPADGSFGGTSEVYYFTATIPTSGAHTVQT